MVFKFYRLKQYTYTMAAKKQKLSCLVSWVMGEQNTARFGCKTGLEYIQISRIFIEQSAHIMARTDDTTRQETRISDVNFKFVLQISHFAEGNPCF